MPVLALLYGLASYLVFFATFLYAIGFLGSFGVPRSVDAGGPASPAAVAIAVNVALLGLFGLQHSIMARRGFKAWWTQFVPKPVERSTYVLFSSAALGLVFWQWRPMPALIWDLESPAARGLMWGLFGFGWALVLVSTLLISHVELFGLKQVWEFWRGQAPAEAKFRQPLLYKVVRHPLYVGWIATFWAFPTMTAGHLLFAAVATGYILVAIQFEERDLKAIHPEYAEYRKRVPMLVPGLGGKSSPAPVAAEADALEYADQG